MTTFAGIAPASGIGSVLAQAVGGALAYGVVRLLFPEAAAVAAQIAEPFSPGQVKEPS